MATRLLIIIMIVIALLAGGLFWLNRRSQTLDIPQSDEPTQAASSDTFHWGIVLRPYGMKGVGGLYVKSQLEAQVTLARELGVTDVRANVETETQTNDDFVNLAIENNLKPTLILEPTDSTFAGKDTYKNAYSFAYAYASRYKGKVPYYQLANEASGVAIKPNAPGNKTTDYDETKYAQLLNLMKGLGDGVHDADPAAERIISANWLGTGVIDRLVADNVYFEIIGWNWYSDMGDDLVKKLDTGKTLNIPQYLSKYNKKFWVVELNRGHGTFDKDTAAQATFLQTFITNTKKHPTVTGVFVYTLTDECGKLDDETGRFGIVELSKGADNVCTVTTKKPAFTTYQNLISQYK